MLSVARLETLDRAAIDTAVAGISGGHLLAILPDREAGAVPILQAACRERGVSLSGACFPELVIGDGFTDRGAVLVTMSGNPPPLLIEGVSSPASPESTARALASYADAHLHDGAKASLLCIFDALVPNIASHLDAWYLRLANRVDYLGINAGNERFTPAPCLFDGERFIGDGALFHLLPDYPGGCLDHGFKPPETLIAATAAEGNRIVQIDWRPAIAVYSELVRSQYGVTITPENFYVYAVHFPFGIVRADGEMLVRIPVALGEDGSIVCVGEVPANSILALLDARSQTTETPQTLAARLGARGGPSGADLLVFYCAGRRLHKGPERAALELETLSRLVGARRMLGALSLGEIGGSRSGGYPLFHNAAVVALPCSS